MAFLYSDLQSEVKRRATRNKSGTEYDEAVKNIVNTSLFRLSREANWKQLRRDTIFPVTVSTETFTLAPQVTDRFFMWHEDYGYPFLMHYIPEQQFLGLGFEIDTDSTPTHYRTWTTDMIKTQPSAASVVQISSSDSGDTNIQVSVFGTVSDYPDSEIITTDNSDGTTAVNGSKSFTVLDRVVKSANTAGRITCTTNSAGVTIAVLPVGDITAGLMYRKVKLYPRANSAFDMNVYYYKDIYRLVKTTDVHELGHDFDEAIILLSVAKINYESNKDEGDKFFGLYKDEVRSLKKHNVDKIDWRPELRKAGDGRKDPLVHPYVTYRQISGGSYGPRSY